MKATIRQAKPADATDIAKVHVLSWQDSYRDLIDEDYLRQMQVGDRENNWLRRLSEAEDIVLVAEIEGKIIGFVHGRKQRDPESSSEAELCAIYILKEYQRQGIGRQLFQAFLEKIQAAGWHSMNIWVLEKNINAGKFYQAMGGQLSLEKDLHKIGDKEYPLVEYVWASF